MQDQKISLDKSEVTPFEAIRLWVDLGWGTGNDYSKDSVQAALDNTFLVVSVRSKNNELIGLARVLSDNVFHTCLIDIAVHPNYRNKGIGRQMMDAVKERFKNTSIYLDALEQNDEFFAKCGYVKRENMAVYSKKFNQE